MSYLEYSKKILKSMEYSVNGLELEMRYDVMHFIINNMQRNHFTQKELAQKLKMKDSQLSKILSGEKNLTLKTIARFFNIFKKKPLIDERKETIAYSTDQTISHYWGGLAMSPSIESNILAYNVTK